MLTFLRRLWAWPHQDKAHWRKRGVLLSCWVFCCPRVPPQCMIYHYIKAVSSHFQSPLRVVLSQMVRRVRWRSTTTTSAGSAWTPWSTVFSWSAVTWSPAPSVARGWTSARSAGSTLWGPCTSSSPNAPPHHRSSCFSAAAQTETVPKINHAAHKLLSPQKTYFVDVPCLYSLKSHIICTLKYYEKCVFLKNLTLQFHQWAERRIVPSYESFLK